MVEETKAGYFSPVVTSDPFEITGPTVSHNFSFTNTPFGKIEAYKYLDNDGSLTTGNDQTPVTGWSMTLQYQKANGDWADATDANLVTGTITNPKLTNAGGLGLVTWDNLKLGTYRVVEADGDTNVWYHLTSTTSDPIAITAAGGHGSATFVNSKYVSLKVFKWFDADKNKVQGTAALEPPLGGWEFTILGSDGTTTKTGTTDATGYFTFSKLPAGQTWTVTETLKDGWTNSKPGPVLGVVSDTTAQLNVNTAQPTLTFGNWRSLDITKTINGAPFSQFNDPNFPNLAITFEVRSGASEGVLGTLLSSVTLNAANNGKATFMANGGVLYLPAGTYALVEIVPYGFSSTLTTVPGWFKPDPNPAGNTAPRDRVAVNFTVNGGAITFNGGTGVNNTVDNAPPNMARTPGFWKNWSSVTGGGQKWVLDQMLLIPGPIYVGPIMLGDAPGTKPGSAADALKAYRILDKSTTNNGTKAASDPAFNLACMYLCYRLNVLSGSYAYTNTQLAAQWANYYLNVSKYNGTNPVKKASDRLYGAQMNALAGFLDRYNNGQLSPSAPLPPIIPSGNPPLNFPY